MPAFPAILIGLLVSPSTWILILIYSLYSGSSEGIIGLKYYFAWFLIIGVAIHGIRELFKDGPWLGSPTPPPGISCSPIEWDSQFAGKPLFAIQLLSLTAIRVVSLILLFAWIIHI